LGSPGIELVLRDGRLSPFTYLRDVFDRISAHPVNRLHDLLPDNWKAAQHLTQNTPA
jgi:hypothetical protein